MGAAAAPRPIDCPHAYAYKQREKPMAFKEYSEERRRKVSAQEQDATRINGLAYRFIDEIFSCDALAYTSFRNFRLKRDKEFNFRLSAHEAAAMGVFEHVWVGNRFGGRWTFWLDQRTERGNMFQIAIFAIEFDDEGRIRYGTEGGWDERIQLNPKEPWKSRDRLISNVVAAIQDHLAQSPEIRNAEDILVPPLIVW
jgi:hypothetical protein